MPPANPSGRRISFSNTIPKKYLHALKSPENAGLIDAALVDEIFFQVPEILTLHEAFLEELRGRLDHWDPLRQQLGDVFLHTFTQQGVIDTYASFINNWKHAKESIKSACQAKPAFARFLNTMAREHKGKLAVDSLLIMPVQRIPRYELLIQMLLKHTEPSHPDYPLLVEAASVVRSLAQSINRRGRGTGTGRGSSSASSGTTIEAWADAILAGSGGSSSSGNSGTRTLLRVDQVTLGGKERSFILFSDLLLIASAKRRTGPSAIRKASTMSTASGFATGLEGHKLKLLMRIPLEDLEIVRGREEAGSVRRALKEAEKVQEDLNVVGKMSHLASSLHCSHSALDDALADLAAELRRRAAEASAMEAPLSQLPLALHTQSGSVETLLAIFPKAETRASWEEALLEAKQKLTDHFPTPEFVSPLPIRKTRAGLQFTCAAPTLPSLAPPQKEGTPPLRESSVPGKSQLSTSDLQPRGRAYSSSSDTGRSGRSMSVTRGLGTGWPEGGGGGEVWVCNSDGYVGQVCVLSLQPEPTVASCNGHSFEVCEEGTVPSGPSPGSRWAWCLAPTAPEGAPGVGGVWVSLQHSALLRLFSPVSPFPCLCSIDLTPASEETEGVDDGNPVRSGDNNAGGTGNIQLDSSSSDSDEEEGEGGSEEGGCISQDEVSSPPPPSPPPHGPPSSPPPPSSLMGDGNDDLMMVDQSFTSGSSGASSCGTGNLGGVPGNQATMWLGTEDGCIHVYHCGDNIRTKRNKLRIQHVAAVLCILYLDDRVYVSLANGDIVVYTREPGGGWSAVESKRRAVGSSATPLKEGCGCDDIIRQHKAACLRVTALLTCQDLLWVGTSAGVILTLAMDRRQLQRAQQLPTSGGKSGSSHSSQSSVGICPTVTGLPHGHTGHVRFLTCVDMPADDSSDKGSTDQKGSKSSTFSSLVGSSSIIPPGTPSTSPPQSYQGSLSSQSLSGWRCLGGGTPSPRTDEKPGGKILVISGGDGYEDFRNSGTGPSSEVAGREDSTNHLLLWQVQFMCHDFPYFC
ncbi:hypothetical protein J437_LFUL004990 [Ladona fulva]|uniref:DH domain-containing protein n=1 Tax=Ladona fulva TaxID=123851 RepID=A0A8K0JXM0_LADFU|nr:hypothetical protein J437_LFUL004990 [Ladona fulva]